MGWDGTMDVGTKYKGSYAYIRPFVVESQSQPTHFVTVIYASFCAGDPHHEIIRTVTICPRYNSSLVDT